MYASQTREEKSTYDDIKEGLTLHIERNVLDDNSGGYNFVPITSAGCLRSNIGSLRSDPRAKHVAHCRRATRRGQIRVLWWRQGPVVWNASGVIDPLLKRSGSILGQEKWKSDGTRTEGRPPRAGLFLRGD